MIFHFTTHTKLSIIRYYDFSVRLRTSSNPADINQFRSHAGKWITLVAGTYESQWSSLPTPSPSFLSVLCDTPLLCMIWVPPNWVLQVYTSLPNSLFNAAAPKIPTVEDSVRNQGSKGIRQWPINWFNPQWWYTKWPHL